MKKNQVLKKMQPEISIKGPFVFYTFLRACRSKGVMEAEAISLFETLKKQGKIIEGSGVGFSGEIKSFTFKK